MPFKQAAAERHAAGPQSSQRAPNPEHGSAAPDSSTAGSVASNQVTPDPGSTANEHQQADAGISPPSHRHATELSGVQRAGTARTIAALMALIPLFALGVARQLEPNSSGLGTHQQLGLPPCSMRLLLGIRCPGCGMTTSWAHFTRGNWSGSMQASAGGFLFALFALWIAFLGIRGWLLARLPGERTQQAIAVAAAGIFAVSLLQWLERLFR